MDRSNPSHGEEPHCNRSGGKVGVDSDVQVILQAVLAAVFGLIAVAAFAFTYYVNTDTNNFNDFKALTLEEQQATCASDAECEWAYGIPTGVAMRPDLYPDGPALVGLGCLGTDRPIYAFEEDHFPRCEEIRAWEPLNSEGEAK